MLESPFKYPIWSRKVIIVGYRALRRFCTKLFFYPSPPSMRNEEAPAKIKKASKGPQNGRRGVERGLILGYWVLQTTSAKLFFFIWAHFFYEKSRQLLIRTFKRFCWVGGCWVNTTLNIVLIWARTLLKTGVKASAEGKKWRRLKGTLNLRLNSKRKTILLNNNKYINKIELL